MAVTKLFTKSVSYNILTDTPALINTNGYKSAKIRVLIDTPSAGSFSFSVKDSNSNNLTLGNKVIGNKSEFGFDYRNGSYDDEFLLDLSQTSSVRVTISKEASFAATSATIEVFFSYEEIEIPNDSVFDITSYGSLLFPVTNKLCKVTLYIDKDDVITNPQIVLNGSTDSGSTWSGNINFIYNKSQTNLITLTPKVEHTIWIASQSYTMFRIKGYNNIRQHIGVRYKVEQVESFEREVIADSRTNQFANLGGGKYIKLLFNDYQAINCSSYIEVYARNSAGNYINPNIYTLDGKQVVKSSTADIAFEDTSKNKCFKIYNYGHKLNGGLILKYDEDFTSNTFIAQSPVSSDKIFPNGDTPSVNRSMSFVISDKPFETSTQEELMVSRNDYDIYNVNIEGKVVDALNDDVLVRMGTNSFKYCRFGIHGLIYDIEVDAEHVPSLIEGESVKFAKLVNYQNISFGRSLTRVCLFTNKNRILYNRVHDHTGIGYFREAPLYNLKKRFYPVNDKSLISDVAKYLPIFPDYDYNQFSGRIDGTDDFGIALPTRGTSVGTLLEDWRKENLLDRISYSTIVISNAYGCVFGNYNLTDADPWVAFSSDGTQFFIVETWASVEDYNLSGITSMKVDLSTIISNAGGYTAGSLKLTRRQYNVPTDTTKEPATPFIIGDSCIIQSISVENNRTYITFVDDSAFSTEEYTLYRFNSMAPIVFFENISASSEYNYICNSVKADGSDNTGVFFRLHRVANNKYELYGDAGDPFETKNVCRHIHSVSEAYGGFLIATGENYNHINQEPFFGGGYLFFITADNRYNAKPNQYTLATVMDFFGSTFRITSSPKSINRACGAVMRGDKKIVFVSDSVQGDRDVNNITIEGRSESLNCKSYGIYKGNVADSDNWSNYQNVCNVYGAALGLVEHNGRLASCEYAGKIHISPDYGDTWYTEAVSRTLRVEPEVGATLDVTGLAVDGSIYYGNNKIVFKK